MTRRITQEAHTAAMHTQRWQLTPDRGWLTIRNAIARVQLSERPADRPGLQTGSGCRGYGQSEAVPEG